MRRNEKKKRSGRAKPNRTSERFRMDSDTTTTGTISISDSSNENVLSLSKNLLEENLKKDTSRCASLLARCKEARIVLQDLKCGDLLTQHQRRQLQPKRCRRRTSSEVSERTKKLLKKIVKEEAEWMHDWTSSSMESVTAFAYFNQSTPKRYITTSTSRKTEAEGLLPKAHVTQRQFDKIVNVSRNDERKKCTDEPKTSRSKGRPKKKTVGRKKNVITVCSTSSHSSCIEVPKENATNSANQTSKFQKRNDLATNPSLKRKETLSKMKKSKGSLLQLSQDKSFRSYEKLSDSMKMTDKKFDSPDFIKINPLSSKQYDSAPRIVIPVTCASNIATTVQRAITTKFDDTSISVRLEDQFSQLIFPNSMKPAAACTGSRENKYISYLNGDFKSENSSSLHQFLQPLEKKVHSLDSIERAIEEDLAAGNNLASTGDGEMLHGILMGQQTIDNLTETLNNNRCVSTMPHQQVTQDDLLHKANEALNVQNTSFGSSESANSLTNGKRRLPEIIHDDLLPSGTIDIASVRPNTPQSDRKRRKIEENHLAVAIGSDAMADSGTSQNFSEISRDERVLEAVKNWKCQPEIGNFGGNGYSIILDNSNMLVSPEKSPIESPSITKKSANDRLSGTVKNWPVQSEIAILLANEERRGGEVCSNVGCQDATNNNRCEPVKKKNTLSNSSTNNAPINSSSTVRPICSSNSNLSDEYRAMAELLSTIDNSQATDNPYDKLILGDSKRRRNVQTVPSSLPDEDKKLDHSGQLKKANDVQPQIIEKLTITNLDRFNTGHDDKAMNEPNSSLSLSEGARIDPQSTARRKRRWFLNEQNTNCSSENPNGKVKLNRKHWPNGQNWTLENVVTSSVTSQMLESLPDQNKTQKEQNALIKYPVKGRGLEKIYIKKNDSPTCFVQAVDPTPISSNNNFPKPSPPCATVCNRNEVVPPELPAFGASSIYNVDASSSSSSSSSSSASSNGSASSSSSSSSSTHNGNFTSHNSQRSASTCELLLQTTVEGTIEDRGQTKSSKLTAELKAPVCPEIIEAQFAIEGMETMEAIENIETTLTTEIAKYQRNGLETKDQNIEVPVLEKDVEARTDVSNIESQTGMKDIEADLAITENQLNRNIHETGSEMTMTKLVSQKEINEIAPEVCTDGMNAFKATVVDEDLDELCDAETLARLKYSAATTKENDDDGDCISLFTESLCMSRCASPPHPEPSRLHRSPVVQEPYARMKSTNISKFVAENNRECEATLRAYEANATNAEPAFPSECTKVPLFPLPTTLVAFKAQNQPIPNNQNETMPDLRSTLTRRVILRDLNFLFRGQCYSWLKIGTCNAHNCRFRHSLKPELQEIRQYDLQMVEKILDYAIKNRYCHFLELIQTKAFTNMTTPQVLSLYGQLYRTRLLTILHIENTFEALQRRGLTLVQALPMLLATIAQEDVENPRKILLAMHKKLEPGTCWDVLGRLLSKVKPPAQVVQTVMEEAIAKNCTGHAINIYERLVKRIPYQVVEEIPKELWRKFHALRQGTSSSAKIEPPPTRVVATSNSGSRGIASPESPRPDHIASSVEQWVASIESPNNEKTSPQNIFQILPTPSRGNRRQSTSSFADTNYSLHPIDKLPPPKCPYRDKLWKFHLDLQGIQEALRHHDYGHVISILSLYAEDPHRMPHIKGFYNILCKEITLAKHHLVEIVRRTVQSGVSDALRLYVYDLGIYVVTKLTDIGAWIHAYELIKTFEVFGQYNTCGFTLLAAQVYIANRRPSKALDLLEQSRIVCTNERKWRLIRCCEDEKLRVTVVDLLLCALCNGYSDDAFRLLDFILRDQCSSFKPINLVPHVERIARRLLLEKRVGLIVDLSHLILQAELFVSTPTFRSIINCVFHDDQILAKQLHRYATWLGTYNRAKINGAACAHMIINTSWTEEETFLMITSLVEDLYENIGHAVDRLKVRDLNVFLIFEVIPTERQLETDICEGPKTMAVWNKHRATLKNVLDRFDPKIKIVHRSQGRVCKLQSRSLVDYLRSGQIRLWSEHNVLAHDISLDT